MTQSSNYVSAILSFISSIVAQPMHLINAITKYFQINILTMATKIMKCKIDNALLGVLKTHSMLKMPPPVKLEHIPKVLSLLRL